MNMPDKVFRYGPCGTRPAPAKVEAGPSAGG